MMRDYLAGIDEKRKQTDKQLDAQVDSMAKSTCTLAEQGDLTSKTTRIYTAIAEAKGRGDAEGCIAMAREGERLVGSVSPKHVNDFNSAAGTVGQAAMCLIQLERCQDARTWWFRYYDLAFSHSMAAADVRDAAEQTFAAQARDCAE